MEHGPSALIQLHLHSWLNIWLQFIRQRQLQDKMRTIFRFGVDYTSRGMMAIQLILQIPGSFFNKVICLYNYDDGLFDSMTPMHHVYRCSATSKCALTYGSVTISRPLKAQWDNHILSQYRSFFNYQPPSIHRSHCYIPLSTYVCSSVHFQVTDKRLCFHMCHSWKRTMEQANGKNLLNSELFGAQ